MKDILTKAFLSILILSVCINGWGQEQQRKNLKVEMNAKNWIFDTGGVNFLDSDSRHIMEITDNINLVTLKGVQFKDGVIEFDIQPPSEGFASVYFRQQSAAERECLYFRIGKDRNSQAADAIQYAPFIDGVNIWDLYPEYQSDAPIKSGEWNHVKMIVSGKQMLVYVNDMQHPALIVPNLEGDYSAGTIAFDGAASISNLLIKNEVNEGLPPLTGADITDNDPRYLRKWQVTPNVIYPIPGIDLDRNDMPDSSTLWEPILAERKGMVNLTRKFGGDQKRRIVWLKTHIRADSALTKRLRLGFSDEVWVFINNQLLYMDKNYFNTLTMKVPNGRISLENTSFDLPLKKGDNEILIGVANAFYGWGIIARLDDNNGILIDN